MALDFEGALDNISETQLAYIRDVLEERGHKGNKVTIEAVGKAGDNYAANVKRVIARNGDGEFRMIAKIAPQLDFIRKASQTDKLFKNEHTMYTRVLPKFQELEEQAGVPKEDRLRFAECYGSSSEAPHEVILLEDLEVPGFIMLDRFKPLSDECIKSVLKNFAILHSLSYALKHKNMDAFKEFTSNLGDIWAEIVNQKETLDFFAHIETTAMGIVEGEERKKYLKGCIREAMAQAAKIAKYNTGVRQNVIQQGDSWTNNVMFKFDGDVLQQSIMIDYQISKESSPVSDVMYCIFNCSDHESRTKHFNEWIDYYHSELDKALSNYGLKVNYMFPRDQMDADMKRYGKLMLGVSIFVASVILTNAEIASKAQEAMGNVDSLEDVYKGQELDKDYLIKFKRTAEGLIDSFLAFGLL